MKSNIEFLNTEGLFDNARRFAFTNITDEVFTSKYDGRPIVVQPHQTIELPHYLIVKLTGELVDKIMLGVATTDDHAHRPTNQFYRSPAGTNFGIPNQREPLERQIARELKEDEESPEVTIIRQEERRKVLADLERSKNDALPDITASPSDLSIIGTDTLAEPKKKAPIKFKNVKK